WLGLAVTVPLLAMDLAFFGANALKLFDGGWVPLALAAAVFTAMTTWRRGREILARRFRARSIPYGELAEWLEQQRPVEVAGTAVYLTAHPDSVPLSLIENVRHNHAIHGRVVLLSILFTQTARVSIAKRLQVERIDERVVRLF